MQPEYRSSKKNGWAYTLSGKGGGQCNDLNIVSLDSDGTSSTSDDLTLVESRTKEPLVESVAIRGRS